MLFASLHALTVDMILISNVQTGILHLSVNCVKLSVKNLLQLNKEMTSDIRA